MTISLAAMLASLGSNSNGYKVLRKASQIVKRFNYERSPDQLGGVSRFPNLDIGIRKLRPELVYIVSLRHLRIAANYVVCVMEESKQVEIVFGETIMFASNVHCSQDWAFDVTLCAIPDWAMTANV